MSLTPLAAVTAVVAGLAASPYLARLAMTVPDRADHHWWRGAPARPSRVVWAAIAATGFGALAGTGAGWSALLPADIALALFAIPLTIIDIDWHRLPDRLMAPAVVAALGLLALAAAVRDEWSSYLRAIEAAGVIFAALFAIAFAAPGAFGLGDVKLGALLGGYLGWVGWGEVFYGLFAGFVIGSLVAVVLLASGQASRKTPIPFGPMLIAGALTVLALSAAS